AGPQWVMRPSSPMSTTPSRTREHSASQGSTSGACRRSAVGMSRIVPQGRERLVTRSELEESAGLPGSGGSGERAPQWPIRKYDHKRDYWWRLGEARRPPDVVRRVR